MSRHALHFVGIIRQVLGSKPLVRVRVSWLRLLSVKVTREAAGLTRLLGLTVRMLLLIVPITKHRIVPNTIHLGLVLLPEVEGVRLEVVAVPRQLPLRVLLMLHLLGVAGQFANDILLLHRSRLGLPMGHLLRALLHTATIKFSLQTFHSLRVIYLGDIRSLLILNIDLIQNHLLAVLWLLSLKLIVRSLALLTRPIYTYISRHAIVGLVVGVVLLRTNAILLNYRMSLVRSSAHVVAH